MTEPDYPELYDWTDTVSVDAQRELRRLVGTRLVSTVVAAVAGAVVWRTGSLDIAGVIAAFAFGIAIITQARQAISHPEGRWYDARAVAESVKSLSWRYAVGGNRFGIHLADSREAFLSAMREQQDQTSDLPANQHLSPKPQITEWMEDLRARDLQDRKDAYLSGRVEDQLHWYRHKATFHRARGKQLTFAMWGFELAGLLAGIAKAVTILPVDLLGIFAAVVAATAAWLTSKQHDMLAKVYANTAQELNLVRESLLQVADERHWATAVDDAEEAVSREHMNWQASRQNRTLI